MTSPEGRQAPLDVEYRLAPVTGAVRVGTDTALGGDRPLRDVIVDDVREALHRSPGLVAVRPLGVGAQWDSMDPEVLWQPGVVETAPGRLALTPDELAKLPAEHDDVAPGEVSYAEPLWAIAVERWGRDWLEAAVRAGMVPHQGGVELAQHGLFVSTRARVKEKLEEGKVGEAREWLSSAKAYRRFAALLIEEAERLEAWRNELFGGEA